MFCKNCGKEIADYDAKCPFCGEENEKAHSVDEANDSETTNTYAEPVDDRSDVQLSDDDFSYVKSLGKVSFIAVPIVIILLLVMFISTMFVTDLESIRALGSIATICTMLAGFLILWQGTFGLIISIVSLTKTSKYNKKVDEDFASGEIINKRKKHIMKGYIYGTIGLIAGIIALILIIQGVNGAIELNNAIQSLSQ